MRALERYLLLQIIDNRWREHLYDMDYLREGIHLRGFAQIEPIVAYKNEAFDLFTDLMNSIWSDFARMVYHVEVEIEVDDPAAAQRRSARPPARRPAPAPSATPAAAARCRAPTRSPRPRPAAARSSSTAYEDGEEEELVRARRRAADRVRGRAGRAQRPVLVRAAGRSTRSATAARSRISYPVRGMQSPISRLMLALVRGESRGGWLHACSCRIRHAGIRSAVPDGCLRAGTRRGMIGRAGRGDPTGRPS